MPIGTFLRITMNANGQKSAAKSDPIVISGRNWRLVKREPSSELTEAEVTQLEHCEAIIQKGFDTFFEVGMALTTIRDERLYRTEHVTFDSYCRQRWGIGSSYARRVIRAAERVKLLPNDGTIPKPTSEFQVRPFLQLDPEVFPKVWQQLVTRSRGGKISASLVKELVAEFSSNGPNFEDAKDTAARRKRSCGRFGEVFTWLFEARKRMQNGETDQALAALERIEEVISRYL